MPVNDRREMIAESAGTQGKRILFLPFRRRGCLHTHDVRRARDRFRSFTKRGCLHIHDVRRARVLQCAPTHDVLSFFYSFVVCSLLCLLKHTNFGEHGYQSFSDKFIKFHSITR